MNNAICLNCQKEFEKKIHNQKFCCVKCSWEYWSKTHKQPKETKTQQTQKEIKAQQKYNKEWENIQALFIAKENGNLNEVLKEIYNIGD